MASEQDLDTLVMENAQLKQEMKDMEGRVTERLQAEIAETREEIAAQFAGFMDFLAKGRLAQGQGNGRNNIGNGAAETSGLEEKQATPARQNLNFIYGSKTPTSAVNASGQDRGADAKVAGKGQDRCVVWASAFVWVAQRSLSGASWGNPECH